MKMHRFEDVFAWQQSKELTILVYRYFKTCTDYGFKDQIQRAAVSVMNNIAEGFERNSDKELRQFLYIAKGSCGEVRSMLIVAPDIGYLLPSRQNELIQLATRTSQLLSGFIKKL
ncbi:MAG TPA: four helix bundle protein [Verrucomicrobiae bacterium]|jgi:four helix bundle protein|nr:four helix bundle protein [Verrucomicrobiae bacterium]